MIELTGANLTIVVIVAVIALAALVVAALLVRQVLAASEGTPKMREIAAAVQEGASAYLSRQFKTLSIFAVIRASRTKRAQAAGMAANGGAMHFTATSVPSTKCSANQTLPIPPSAIFFTSRSVLDRT